MLRRRSLALVAIVVVATSVACSSEKPPESADERFDRALAEFVQLAKEGEATPEQIAILEEAQQTGEVSFDVYSAAVDRALRCIRETGGQVDDRGAKERNGVPMRSYSVEASAEAANPAEVAGMSVHRCLAEHSSWVEMVYQGQSSTVEAEDAHWEQFREPVVECLREQGIEIDVNAPIAEIRDVANLAYINGEAEVSCAAEFGLR